MIFRGRGLPYYHFPTLISGRSNLVWMRLLNDSCMYFIIPVEADVFRSPNWRRTKNILAYIHDVFVVHRTIMMEWVIMVGHLARASRCVLWRGFCGRWQGPPDWVARIVPVAPKRGLGAEGQAWAHWRRTRTSRTCENRKLMWVHAFRIQHPLMLWSSREKRKYIFIAYLFNQI